MRAHLQPEQRKHLKKNTTYYVPTGQLLEQQSTSGTAPEVCSICSEAVTSKGLPPLGEPCLVVQWVSHVKGGQHLFLLILPFYIPDGCWGVEEVFFRRCGKRKVLKNGLIYEFVAPEYNGFSEFRIAYLFIKTEITCL
ncbi:hypothetical protein TNCT_630671 [Trichonephila clavata]|uniref:Uncharacterized protein n=1 Tax=Trichonephila clavata TaxID=2740835 RepID=A0A8X6F884_TRICU|nr:hypothetical protein TNCT_630671 [Trichonephila clavata]